MKIISILILTSFMFGCSIDVTPAEIEEVEKFCSKNGGLKKAEFGVILEYVDEIQCNDNAVYFTKVRSLRIYTSDGKYYDKNTKKKYNTKWKYVIKE